MKLELSETELEGDLEPVKQKLIVCIELLAVMNRVLKERQALALVEFCHTGK